MSYFEEMAEGFRPESLHYTRLKDIDFQTISPVPAPSEFSPLAEYYMAPFLFVSPRMCINLPLIHVDLHHDQIKPLLGHFDLVRVLSSRGMPVELRLENLKPDSKEKFVTSMRQKKINPFILDLYQFDGEHESSGNFSYFKLRNERFEPKYTHVINPTHIKDFNEIWAFNKRMYADKKYILLCPNWPFSDQLIECMAMKYFAMACKEVFLSVDTLQSRVNGIYLSVD